MLPAPLRIRLACVAAIAAACVAGRRAPTTFAWTVYAVGFGHYLLALRYSAGPLRRMLASGSHLLALLGLVLVSTALYQADFPLFVYFALHHAMNEAYLRRSIGGWPAAPPHLNAAAAVFHAAAYFTALRWAPELAGIDPPIMWVAFAAAAALFVWTAVSIRDAGSPRKRLERYAPEATSAALVALSLFINLTFLDLVLFHFLLWALLPVERVRQRSGTAGLIGYVAWSLACTGVALSLSPVGPRPLRLPVHTYTELFLFWSYLHITLSFALSDAHPAWVVRLFRTASPQALSVPATAARP